MPELRSTPTLVLWLHVTISAWLISVQASTVCDVTKTLRQRFGERVRALRVEAGLSQEAFADQCGFARSYMSRVERGAGNPSLDAIQVFADALGVPVDELFRSTSEAGRQRSARR